VALKVNRRKGVREASGNVEEEAASAGKGAKVRKGAGKPMVR